MERKRRPPYDRNLGRAFIRVAAEGYSNPLLYSRDINALAAMG